MNTFKKIVSIVWSLIVIFLVVLIIDTPLFGYLVILLVFSIGLIVAGIKDMVFYCTMAKHMVGGKSILYRSIILLNFGIFTLTMLNIPHLYIMIYFLAVLLFSGFISIMRSMEMKKNESPWKLKLTEGIMYVLIAIVGIIFINSLEVTVYIYCAALVYSAIMRIISAFRKHAMVYIQ